MTDNIEITFSADDDCFVRADNICAFAGLSARDSFKALMAKGILTYMKLDALEQHTKTGSE